jgi:serine/threonine-protein kinase TTK/MPS1
MRRDGKHSYSERYNKRIPPKISLPSNQAVDIETGPCIDLRRVLRIGYSGTFGIFRQWNNWHNFWQYPCFQLLCWLHVYGYSHAIAPMAAIVSPTPLLITSNYANLHRRPSNRANLDRPLTRRRSPLTTDVKDAASNKASIGDSSDDEDLAPIKLSAEAEEILGEAHKQARPEPGADVSEQNGRSEANRHAVTASSSNERFRLASSSPKPSDGSPAPRVVRVAARSRPTALGTLERDGSFLYKNQESTIDRQSPPLDDSVTPAPPLRRVRVSGSRSATRPQPSTSAAEPLKASGRVDDSSADKAQDGGGPSTQEDGSSPADEPQSIGPSTVMRPRRGEENGAHSTMRVKRIGAGSFLTGPVRRGIIRRQSEEDDAPIAQKYEASNLDASLDRRRSHGAGEAANLSPGNNDPAVRQHASFASSATSVEDHGLPLHLVENVPLPLTSNAKARSTPGSNMSNSSSRASSSRVKPVFKVPPLPALPSAHDQENEPPPTFKRSKQSGFMLGEVQKLSVLPDEKPASQAPHLASPQRQPLAPRSQNTPHRPAPAPPPKMSIIEAATSTAGAARKKKVNIMVNGRVFTRLDCIGRGGSSRVYRVMAENYKIFALKRVNLEDADSVAIAGYRGEIDLLRRLENVEQVIRLFDYEINDEKGTLSVLMEMGESDFNQMLNRQLKTETAKLDVSFTRYYWKEMLECVQAVHDFDIVHSDLKPANFLLVQGRLKLIDFGIANAIQDDTVNVHRENQIGTPNYMSPESLVCHSGGGPNGMKLLKLGKPSDVWSLGCILYQMTYGQPPFAHIQKQFERIMSIPNPKVEIQFPASGVGGVTVPFGLIKTLRRCLQRDQILRPSIQELLGDADPFLNPVAISADMLGRMISNVVRHCRKREDDLRGDNAMTGKSAIPTDEEIRAWPLAFYEKLRQAQEDGTAW